MPNATREVRPSQKPGHVINEHAVLELVPSGWILLPPGDSALSRRIKADGPTWTMSEMKGRKRLSQGIWAPAHRIEALRAELLVERADPAHQRKLDSARDRRAVEQADYVEDFRAAVLTFLAFHCAHAGDAQRLADLIAAHATPVGSGTVARTKRIPIQERAEAATIAWLRHQTTGYDQMRIPLIKGRRREVRHLLAQRSHQLLRLYREGRPVDHKLCPLQTALRTARPAPATTLSPSQAMLF
ncbi:MAG: DUF2293 domain-containing protein [Opitutaceae bacterium]|nr:DUF2293 domain-containing protein [Opitutaceae bacterium]